MYLFPFSFRDIGINVPPCIAMVEDFIVVFKHAATVVLFKKISNCEATFEFHLLRKMHDMKACNVSGQKK